MTTIKGYSLAAALKLTDPQQIDTCARICRAARTYSRIQEDMCNGHPIQGTDAPIETVRKLQARWDARCEREDARLEALIKRHVATLAPHVVAVKFNGDPRGCTVVLMRPTDRTGEEYSDGVCVPGS